MYHHNIHFFFFLSNNFAEMAIFVIGIGDRWSSLVGASVVRIEGKTAMVW